MDYIISTESTCDLQKEYLAKLNVRVIDMLYLIDGVPYGKNGSQPLPPAEFYQKMREGAKTATSMINEVDAEEYFNALLQEGKDILHIAFASACSGTYDNLRKIADKLNKRYSQKIYVLDSKCESTGEGLLVDYAVQLKNDGISVAENFVLLQNAAKRLNSLFTVDNLKYLAAGGRVSHSTALLANMIKIKPLLYVEDSGKLIMGGKTIGRKKALARLVELTEQKISEDYDKIFVSHADCKEDALFVIEKFKHKFPDKQVLLEEIGPVIGAHSGPGTLAIFFFGKPRSF